MNVLAPLIFVSIAIHGACAAAQEFPADARVGTMFIRIPAGLNGPDRSFPHKAAELHVYFSRKDVAPTVLQLTRMTIAEARPDLDERTRFNASADVLAGFLQTFSKNVQEWKRSPVEQLRLGGRLAVRAKWSGNFHGMSTTGVMYFLVFGKESYCFHTFGRADVPNVTLESSIRAIEEVRW